MEKKSIERADKIKRNIWIRENKELNELIKMFRDDEKKHHKALMKLTVKMFFKVNPNDLVAVFGSQNLEERFIKYEKDTQS